MSPCKPKAPGGGDSTGCIASAPAEWAPLLGGRTHPSSAA